MRISLCRHSSLGRSGRRRRHQRPCPTSNKTMLTDLPASSRPCLFNQRSAHSMPPRRSSELHVVSASVGPAAAFSDSSCGSGSGSGPLYGGGAIGALLAASVAVFLVLLHREKRIMKEYYDKNGGPILKEVSTIKIFKKEELKPILKSSNIVGKGCFGEVYKGILDDKQVAVKKPGVNVDPKQKGQFANEVIIQSRMIHKNIVSLIGCCLEVDVPILVYEFISKGSLDDILHGISKEPLSLDQRLTIAAESAEGLAYMHSKTNNTILHGDVKPANILLNDDFMPKISDFGISRLIAIDREQHANYIIGDKSYMDPVYLQTGLLTNKSDVYSFGAVLLELISRKKATYADNNNLVMSFLDAHKTQKITELFDKEITTKRDIELLQHVAGIAVECLKYDVHQRPEMTDVAERLLKLKRSHDSSASGVDQTMACMNGVVQGV